MESVQLAPASTPLLGRRPKVGLSTGMIQAGKTGVAQYILGLLRAMIVRPDCPELTLFVLENDLPLFSFVEHRATVVVISERDRSPIRNIVWHQLNLPKLVRRMGLDVLHVPSYRRMLWPQPCALVATIHDLAPFYVTAKYDPARMFYGRVVVRRLAQRQHEIIAVSQNTAADIQRFFGIMPGRVHVIYNGLDHDRFCLGDAAAARAEVGKRWNLNQPFFLYVSRLEHPGKNHVRLIEAFNRFKASTASNWMLVFGGSDWHGADVIYAAARQSKWREDIRFLGFVADADLPTIYRAAGAVVYPSLFEGFGFPPIEAMACGCPVLSSTRGALAEVVADAAGIIDPEDVEQMEANLQRIGMDEPWREHLRAAGLRNAQRFDWNRNAEQVLACYDRAAASTTPRPATLQFRTL